MSNYEKSILKYIFIYLFVFFIGRSIFLIHNFSDWSSESIGTILSCFYHGIRMDLSALSYISPLILSLFFIHYQFKISWILPLIKTIFAFSFFLFFAIVIGELPIYDEWVTKLTPKAISYLSNIQEVFRTATWNEIAMSILGVPFLTFLSILLINKILKQDFIFKRKHWSRNLAIYILSLAFGFLGARGGFYQIPLSASGVFYSNNRTLNFAASNSIWSLGYSYYKEKRYDDKTKFHFYSKQKVNDILKNYQNKNDSTPSILNTQNPNIIFILYESWSGDLVDTLNELYHITPEFQKIKKEALYFNHCYATGRHSEEGILATFAGYPSLADSYLMGFTAKNGKLPSTIKKLKERNYQASFFFGGDLGYANIKSFFFQNPFYKIYDEENFSSSYKKGKLGYHDDALYNEMFKESLSAKKPFFIGGFTTSTHSPYDVPMKHKKITEVENEYINSVVYADSCLGSFFEKAKKTKWYKNTLFILISDHSHPTPLRSAYCSEKDHRIVFMLTGGALKKAHRNTINTTIMSQIDIPATILTQLNFSTEEFPYSRNILGKHYHPFVYFADKSCLGIYAPQGFVKYSLTEDKIIQNRAYKYADSLVQVSKALLQKSYTQFQDL